MAPSSKACGYILVLVVLLSGAGGVGAQEGAVIQLSFSNPGARSMSLGGAFVGLADDATAALANPAGLVQLLRPEVSGELRVTYTEGSDSDTDPWGDANGYSFLSAVYPHGRWSLAAYRHNLASIDLRALSTSKVGESSWPFNEFDITNSGLAAGYRISEQLCVGVGVSYFVGDLAARVDLDGPDRSHDWGASGGMLLRLSPRWGLGASFRQGPEFRASVAWIPGLGQPEPWAVVVDEPVLVRLSLPDVFRLGGWYRSAGGAFTVTGEWERLSFSSAVTSVGGDDRHAPAVTTSDQVHLGAEFVFLKATPMIAVRSGLWLEPSDLPVRGLGSDQLHYAAGVGWVWNRFQLDLGLDVADMGATMALSGLVSF